MLPKKNNQDFQGVRVLVVGLGVHGGGVATVKWLMKQGAIVRVADVLGRERLAESIKKLKGLPITYHLGAHQAADFRWAERIVVNPAVSPKLLELVQATKRGIHIDNEASLFVERFPGTIVGVTGTRGKTTTTLLLGSIIKAAHRNTIISGNVREVAMLDYLPKTIAKTIAVLELSSYQLERLPVAGHPVHVGVMTNLKVDHLNRHGSMAEYAQVKYRLFGGQIIGDVAVLNYDDPHCRRLVKKTAAHVLWFGRHVPKTGHVISIRAGWVSERISGKWKNIVPLSAWKLAGDHNVLNLLAAAAAARAMQIAPAKIVQSVRLFRGVPHRQEVVRVYRGHQCINDTAATSPDGTQAALAVFPNGVFIVGGTDKALDMEPLARDIVRRNVQIVTLPGSATEKLIQVLTRLHYRRPMVRTLSMVSAIRAALTVARPSQPIVLSPGAASFGLFIHEFDRGEQFVKCIKALP